MSPLEIVLLIIVIGLLASTIALAVKGSSTVTPTPRMLFETRDIVRPDGEEWRRTGEMDQSIIWYNMRDIADSLEQAGFNYYVAWGSLIGIVREGGPIKIELKGP